MTSRLVLVTRRFWPLVGAEATSTAHLAAHYATRGVEVVVLAPRHPPQAPLKTYQHGATVLRLPGSSRLGFGGYRFDRAVATWLRRNAEGVQLISAVGLKEEAFAAVREARRARVPVVLRIDRPGPDGDCHWQLDARFGHRMKRTCFQASALVADSATVEQELIAGGYPRDRIHVIRPGVERAERATSSRRNAARRALTSAHPALATETTDAVVACLGSLHRSKGLDHLLAAWPTVHKSSPDAKLWIVGQGPCFERLAPHVERRLAKQGVALPGVFDDATEVLDAADVYISPALDVGTSWSLLEAMARGLPIVATDVPGHRETLAPDAETVEPENPAALARAINELLSDQERARRQGLAVQRWCEERFSIDQMVSQYDELFTALCPQLTASVPT